MNIYKAGRKTFVVISKSFPNERAITIANQHFRTKRSNLVVQSGRISGDDLYLSKTGTVWAVSKKGKADS